MESMVLRPGLAGVVAQGKIAAAGVDPPLGVLQSGFTEIAVQKRLLSLWGQLLPGVGGGFGERAAEALEGLVADRGIDGRLMDTIHGATGEFFLVPEQTLFQVRGG